MKIACCLISLFLIGCQSVHNRSQSVVATPVVQKYERLTFLQRLYMWRYESYRSDGIKRFELSENATAEDFRPHIAKALGLPEQSSFSEILADEKVKKKLSEELRLNIISTFDLPKSMSWFEIKDVAEDIRLQRLKSK